MYRTTNCVDAQIWERSERGIYSFDHQEGIFESISSELMRLSLGNYTYTNPLRDRHKYFIIDNYNYGYIKNYFKMQFLLFPTLFLSYYTFKCNQLALVLWRDEKIFIDPNIVLYRPK